MNMILTDECVDCEYCTVQEKSKADIFIVCSAKEKTYRYGQCIPCEQKRKKVVRNED